MMETKKCYRCREIKPIVEFCYCDNSFDLLGAWCRDCVSKKNFEYGLHRHFGITVKQYELMLKSQNEKCAICDQPEITKDKNGVVIRLSVDHCSIPFKIRGLLCNNCNLMLGKAKDNSEILRKAAEYLEKHK